MSVRDPSDDASPWSAWFNALNRAPSLEQSQRWLAERMDKFVRSDAFLSQVGKAMEGSLVFKAQMDRWMEQSLRAMRLPTTGDLDLIFQRLDDLERRLDRIERAPAKAAARAARPAASKAESKAESKPEGKAGGKKG